MAKNESNDACAVLLLTAVSRKDQAIFTEF
jgi:hypothetical protein